MQGAISYMISVFRWMPLLLAVAIVTSCSDLIYDYPGACDEPVDEDAKVDIQLEVKTPAGRQKTPTRSFYITDEDRQNRISNVLLILFSIDVNGNPDRMMKVLSPYYFEQDEYDKTLYHAYFAAALKKDLKNKKVRVGIIANASNMEEALVAAAEEGRTFAEMRSITSTVISDSDSELESDLTPRTPADVPAPFVMWGLPPDIISLTGDMSVAIESCLMRDMAAFDVWLCDELKQSGLFDFRTVHFYKPSASVMHVPEMSQIVATTDVVGHPYYYATVPTLLPDNKRFYRWDYLDDVKRGEFRNVCFVPEGEVVMKGVNGGAGKIRDINHTNRPAVIVGGYYNGAAEMSYYRIDVCNEEGNLVDILRNHLYDIEIRSVLGPGQPTPDEAYDNNNIMIVAQVTDWCRVDLNVMYNGSDWITVSKRVINLTGNAGSGTTFIINSSVPLEEWEFKLGEDDEFSKDALLGEEEEHHFFVTRPVAQRGSKILVVTKRERPPHTEPVSERLYVRIGGRVLFYITLVQHPIQDNYWFFGGYFPGTEGPWEPVIQFPIGGLDPHIPPNNFVEFLKWLFGGDYYGTIGEGDNVSDSQLIDIYFWKFITWFFTDEYGHVIGGTPEDWEEAWDNPIAVIIFNLLKWMMGDRFFDEVYGPDFDPNDPDNPSSSLGFEIFLKFMAWLQGEDIYGHLSGFDDPFNPSDPSQTKLGFEIFMKFLSWLEGEDFVKDLDGTGGSGGDDKPGTETSTPIDMLFDLINWFIVNSFDGYVGDDPNGDDPGTSTGSGTTDIGLGGDDAWTDSEDNVFNNYNLGEKEQ